ncbi:hypothetical protein WJX72_005425 [[Myrmecia] bisecta]|uniref:CFEM domain-containing protein n=1 Tax=[Myrmecia] bisecta TaxID=41462 RepID=A0AAW1QF24_9CHLO
MGHRIAWTAFCALCAVNFAAAQIVVGTPACTQSCLNQSLQASGVSQACAGSDAGCLCNNQGYAAASVECFHSTCSLNDERTGLEAIEDACRQLLVARLPKKPNEPGQFHGFDTTEVSAFTTYLQQEALLAGLVSNPLVAALTADSTGASPPGAGAPPPGVAAAAPTTSKTNAGSPPTASPVGTGSTSTTTSGSTGALNQLTVALSFAASRLLSNADRDALLAAVKTYTSAKNVTLSLGSTEKFFRQPDQHSSQPGRRRRRWRHSPAHLWVQRWRSGTGPDPRRVRHRHVGRPARRPGAEQPARDQCPLRRSGRRLRTSGCLGLNRDSPAVASQRAPGPCNKLEESSFHDAQLWPWFARHH